jgi:hypothetical protein
VKYGDPVSTKTELKSAGIKIGPAQADSFSFEAVKDKFHRIPANEEEHASVTWAQLRLACVVLLRPGQTCVAFWQTYTPTSILLN